MGSGKNFYNSKHKTQNQKSFIGGDRFHGGTIVLIQKSRLQAQVITRSQIRLNLTAYISYPT